MLRLSKKTEYALMAVKYIASNDDKNCITAKEISNSYNISYELVSKALQQLVKYEVVQSIQGARGGYRLSKTPGNVTLMDIILAVEPDYKITCCMKENSSNDDCEHFHCCEIRDPLIKVQKEIDNLFINITINEII
jgi:Rrf2 family protein